MPRQDLLQLRKISMTSIIWADPYLDQADGQRNTENLRQLVGDNIPVDTAVTVEEAYRVINSSVRSIIIMSGQMARAILPHVYTLEHVHSIIIFCFDVESYKQFAEPYKKKVILVSKTAKEVILRCHEELTHLLNKGDLLKKDDS